MQKAIWKRCILLGLILSLRAFPARAEEGWPTDVSVTVAVHNHAGISARTLLQAERTATMIFKQAGLTVDWANCDLPGGVEAIRAASSCQFTEFPRHLQLSIAPRSQNLNGSVLGVSFLDEDGNGCYSDVFFEPSEILHKRLHLDLGTLLGHVVAHEIAHLLLGTNAHSETGIMRPHWNERDLVDAAKGGLLFTRAQGQTMRGKVTASLCAKERAVLSAGSDTH